MKHLVSLLVVGVALGALTISLMPSSFLRRSFGASTVDGGRPATPGLIHALAANESGVPDERVDAGAGAGPYLDAPQVAALGSSERRIASAGPEASAAEAAAESSPMDEIPANEPSRLEVHVTGKIPPGLAAVALSTLDEDHHDFFVEGVIDGSATMELKDGPYLIFLEAEGHAVSAYESVQAGRRAQRIELHLVEPVTVTGVVEDSDGPLPGVEIFVSPFTEDQSALAKTLDRATSVRTGSDGRFAAAVLQRDVTYQLRVEDERFVRHSRKIEVAAAVNEPESAIDVGTILLQSGHQVEVQLEGWADWGQVEEFSISGRDIHGRKHWFDSGGRASLPCGELGTEYLNLWYPGGEPTVMANVQVEVEKSMVPVLLKVGGARDLTIGLSHSDEVEELLRGPHEFFLCVNFRASAGGFYSLNMEVDGFRDYRAFGIDSDEVTVRLLMAENNLPYEWMSRRVSFEGARSLRVDLENLAPPKKFRIAIDAKAPLSGGFSYLRRRDDPTDWYSSDVVDTEGLRKVPSAVSGRVLLSYWQDSGDLLCMDVPVATGPEGEVPDTVFIGPLVDAEFSVQDRGVALPKAWFCLCSREDPIDIAWYQTGDLGERVRLRMAPGSLADVKADTASGYHVKGYTPLRPGHQVIEVRRFGSLRLPPGVAWDEVRSVEFDRTLEEWRSETWFKVERPDGGAGPSIVSKLPHGVYQYLAPGTEAPVSTLVLPGEIVQLER